MPYSERAFCLACDILTMSGSWPTMTVPMNMPTAMTRRESSAIANRVDGLQL
jgi:hypothetical protein